MTVPISNELTRPIASLLVAPEPDRALAVRRTALECGIAVRCVSDPLPPGGTRRTASGAVHDVAIVSVEGREQGVELIERLIKADGRTPVLALLSRPLSSADRAALLAAGAADTVDADCTAEELSRRVTNVVHAAEFRVRRGAAIDRYEEEVRSAIGEILLREYEALYVLGKASEFKDQETGSHIARVAHYSRMIARMIGQPESVQETAFHASALHDVGKIGIPDSILLKPGPLDDDEAVVMRSHTTNGHGMLEAAQSSFLLTGAMIALTHHEKYDGTGYPMGLAGEEIPLLGRIVGVADVFDALTTRRPYKEAWSLDDAFELLRSERGKHFDPLLVDAFVYNAPSVRSIFEEHRDDTHWERLITEPRPSRPGGHESGPRSAGPAAR